MSVSTRPINAGIREQGRRDLTAACARHRRMFFWSALFSGAMLPCQRGPLALEASPGAPQVTSFPPLAALPPRFVCSLIADLDPGSAPVHDTAFLASGMGSVRMHSSKPLVTLINHRK